MMPRDLESAIQQSHDAVAGIFRGEAAPAKPLFSDREDVTLGNPFGPYARGRDQVDDTLDRAASNYRDGEFTGAELVASYVSADLACVVEVERARSAVAKTFFRSLCVRRVCTDSRTARGSSFIGTLIQSLCRGRQRR
jgi:hypothetical protein